MSTIQDVAISTINVIQAIICQPIRCYNIHHTFSIIISHEKGVVVVQLGDRRAEDKLLTKEDFLFKACNYLKKILPTKKNPKHAP